MLIVGFDGLSLTSQTRRLLDDPLVSGVILFRRNVDSLVQVGELCSEIHEHRQDLLISVDQEGGPVRRLRDGFPDVGPMRNISSPNAAYEAGRKMGHALRQLGFDINFAPVLDVDSNPQNPVIGPRSFSSDPHAVSERAIALHHGLAIEGIISCGKHFPGHGDTDVDSHLDLPLLKFNLERLHALELIPFHAAIQADIPMLMTAHILLPLIDPEWPATLSPAIVGGILREQLGYSRVVVSDDLEMAAVADRYSPKTMVEQGVAAGLDLFLMCHSPEKQWEAIKALRTISVERRTQSEDRIRNIRPDFSTVR